VGYSQLLYIVKVKISNAKRGWQKNPKITHGLPDNCPSPLCMPALFLFDYLILKANTTTNANNNKTNNYNRQQQQPYYNQTPTTLHGQDGDKTMIQNNTTTNMSKDKQRPATATFEEAFRDVQPRPDLEATLMARYPKLQVEADRVRRARQDEEQYSDLLRSYHNREGRLSMRFKIACGDWCASTY
jgi:hypothetical protein